MTCHRFYFVLKHLITIGVVLFLALFILLFYNPCSTHRFVKLNYKEFDQVPNELVGYNYNLPKFNLQDDSKHDILKRLSPQNKAKDFKLASQCVQLVRENLNSTDKSLPISGTVNIDHLYKFGKKYYSICSEYSKMLNEVLQVCGFTSRVIWLEGHVSTEYFDEVLNKWVYLDSALNMLCISSDNILLSTAQIIEHYYHDTVFEVAPIIDRSIPTNSLQYGQLEKNWHRNILLNGECYAVTGNTLVCTSHWTHLIKYQNVQTYILLNTPFDNSQTNFVDPLSYRKLLIVFALLLTAFYSLAWLHSSAKKTIT